MENRERGVRISQFRKSSDPFYSGCGTKRGDVEMPSTITTHIFDVRDHGDQLAVRFEVRGEDGGAAVDRGVILLDR